MRMSTTREVDWESQLTAEHVEYAYGLAKKMQEARNEGWAMIGLRAAKARDSRLLRALERMAEVTGSLQESQIGRLMRDPDAKFGETRGTTEHQLCREAYKAADAGEPLEQLQWIYGSAAFLCGYNR